MNSLNDLIWTEEENELELLRAPVDDMVQYCMVTSCESGMLEYCQPPLGSLPSYGTISGC